MKIVINSDILHSESLRRGSVQARLAEFCRHCASVGATLVLPRTVVLEDERHQNAMRSKAATELRSAADLLARYGQSVSSFDADTLAVATPVAELLRKEGTDVVVVDPVMSDYRDAERRASLRLPPAPADAKSDEMRDLVIWAVAVRLAKTDAPVLLLSQDRVHVGESARDEAEELGLLRAKNLDEASEALGTQTEAGKLAVALITPVWAAVRTSGVPLPEAVKLTRLSSFTFSADASGRASGSMAFEAPTDRGPLSGHLEIMGSTGGNIEVKLRDVKLDRKPWSEGERTLSVRGELPSVADSAESRLDDLRRTIQEAQ